MSAARRRRVPARRAEIRGQAGWSFRSTRARQATQVIGPQTVNHYDQLPAVTISFGLARGSSLGDVLTRVRRAQANLRRASAVSSRVRPRPSRARCRISLLLVVAILVVYIVLGSSTRHPPADDSLGAAVGGFGALVTLIIFRMDLNIYAFVGMIMLIGIVEKTRSAKIDFALEQEREGKSPDERSTRAA